MVYRCGQEVVVLPVTAAVSADAEKLAVIFVHEDSALLVNAQSVPSDDCPSKSMWLVASKTKQGHSDGCTLKEGDVLRLSNYEWTVTEISADHDHLPPNDNCSTVLEIAPEDTQCKICLSHETSVENPLVAPCSCKGSVEYIHVSCLDRWLSSKIRHKDMHYRSQYDAPVIKCSLCGDPLPMDLEVNGTRYSNLGLPKPKGRYVVLRENSTNEVQLWHWDNCRTLGVGAGGENELRLDGLSDFHAKLTFEGHELRVRDRHSQFGSLVLVQKPMAIHRGDCATVQAANVVLQVRIKRGGLFGCFSTRRRSVSFQELVAEDLS